MNGNSTPCLPYSTVLYFSLRSMLLPVNQLLARSLDVMSGLYCRLLYGITYEKRLSLLLAQ